MVDFGAIALAASGLLPAIIGPVASVITKQAEKAPVVPYKAQTIGSIVLAVFLAALTLAIVAAGATGRLAGDWNSLVKVLVDAIVGTLCGCGVYSLTQARKPIV
jgi:hypothetical protein